MTLSKLDKASVTALKICMGVKKNEKILIITDENKRDIGYSLYCNALRLGNQALFVEMKSGKVNGEEPPKEIASLMKTFDVVLCPTTKSLTHTKARREASANGVRVATFPGITNEVMIRGMNADYEKITALSLKLKKILDKGNFVRITSKVGTDLSFSIEGRKAIASNGLFHKKGKSGNLPTGETFLAPVEGSANGVFVVDGSMAGFGLIKNSNKTTIGAGLKIIVENGYATKFSGNIVANKLNDLLNQYGINARNIAEFGIGTNDKAKLSGVLLEDEKVLGTIHIALGNNLSMGGSVDVPIHLDGVVKNPTVFLDNKLLMEYGKLLI
ncbi:MAG: aminopeptidase [Ignavibacteriaceae bacterium]